MHLSRNPLRLLTFVGTAAILTLGVGLVAPGRSPQPVTVASRPAAFVDDIQVPPHREPAPPPPPPPPSPLPAPPPKPLPPKDALRAGILNALGGSTSATRGIYVEVDGFGKVVDSSGTAMLIPASLTKLFTGASAMLRLGTDYRFKTEVVTFGTVVPDGTLSGSLALAGGGDPSLEKAHLYSLAAGVKGAGIANVSGDLYADEGRFDWARSAPGWKPTYFPKQVGSLSALAVDHNTWRTDPAFYDNPAMGNLELFRAILAESGIGVSGANRIGRPEGTGAVVASRESAPLGALLTEMLRKSDNFYAELILKELGRSIGSPTTGGGLDVTRSVAQELGVARGPVFDGSGLSLGNRESALHIVQWLQAVERSSVGDTFRHSLAVTCSGGSSLLEKRLCGTAAAGRVFGKTGALAQSRSLAGYSATASGRKVWFAFVLNDVSSADKAWAAIDSALVAINTFNR